ncbi:MAG: 16S rRNA (cytidine(1402)-2'-O)-methyltransferase [Myxococcota bacterium]|nr:16S rRNA (cytidine(1402)-2'-O)-methyltransferase [Myxococcota bacterium]
MPAGRGAPGSLHVVATPIGNLEDVTLRALRLLREADLVLAEDTRHVRRLLERHGIEARARSLHAHNEAARVKEVLAVLEGGGDVALVSDAGTPLVSDPGERLVAAAAEAGFAVVPVPGPSAVLAALAVSGLPAAPFTFLGFLPRKKGACDALLARLRDAPETLVLFESPRRVSATLRRLAEQLGDRPACLARELTKLHEEVVRAPLSELAERFAEGARGEVTLVIGGAEGAAEEHPETLDEEIRARLETGESARDIASALAGAGRPRRDVYARVLALREGD